MSMGLAMKAMNAQFFKRKLNLLHEFVPQITMLICMFGYMDLLILIKWHTDYTGVESKAPSIITTMVNMFLGGGLPEGMTPLFTGQYYL